APCAVRRQSLSGCPARGRVRPALPPSRVPELGLGSDELALLRRDLNTTSRRKYGLTAVRGNEKSSPLVCRGTAAGGRWQRSPSPCRVCASPLPGFARCCRLSAAAAAIAAELGNASRQWRQVA